ncbi:GRIN2B (predicted) [Pycnogonum litorale]
MTPHRCSTCRLLFVAIVVTALLRDVLTAEKQKVTFGVIVPNSPFLMKKQQIRIAREYYGIKNERKFKYTRFYDLTTPAAEVMAINPSPNDVIRALCDQLIGNNIAALLYISKSDLYVKNLASAQYLLQLTGHLGIPVIAWNADNSGLDLNVAGQMVVQMAPTVKHQVAAMLTILNRYNWTQFSVLTSKVNGHHVFIQTVRDQVSAPENQRFNFKLIEATSIPSSNEDQIRSGLVEWTHSESRVILLYATRDEAALIFSVAKEQGLTTKDYIWITTQSITGPTNSRAVAEFPRGMLGVTFDSMSEEAFLDALGNTIKVFGHTMELFAANSSNLNISLRPNISCLSSDLTRWKDGEEFFKYIKRVSFYSRRGGYLRAEPPIEFTDDGAIKYAKIDVMNLNKKGIWDKIGEWTRKGLDIKDIFWPGNSALPPVGKPEKFKLKVTFLEEPPYLSSAPPDNTTGLCKTTRAVKCRVSPEMFDSITNSTKAIYKCCSGLTIDLLEQFATDLGFEYEMYRVEDGVWGTEKNGTWNGLIADLIKHKADIVVTSIKINSEREKVVDFTTPFLDTGIAIVVAKRTGIISPKAFLEPFDTVSWLLILLVSIQVAAFFIFAFEWLSPDGYNMKVTPPRDHKFSLFRTYWLVWALLFGAAVNMDCPRGYSARFMASIWATFAVVFLAIYTANLAAFMITREEFYDLNGIEDNRLQRPRSVQPAFKFGTVPNGNTWAVMKRNFPEMYAYMKKYNRSSVSEGVEAVKRGGLDAFIYDSTVLDYLVSQDSDCKLLSVGSWYAMTGYGFALPKKSKYVNMFSKQMMKYRELGDIERLQRFWLTGACKPKKNRRNSSTPLSINQFMSAFLLLGCGMVLTIFLLFLEHIYFKYVRKHLAKKDTGGCFALVSLSMGKSLTFRGAVYEAQDWIKRHRCRDPLCDTQLWKVKHELDMAKIKIAELESQMHGKPLPPLAEILKPRDRTKPYVSTNELGILPLGTGPGGVPQRFHDGHYYRPVSTEIAEMETVL